MPGTPSMPAHGFSPWIDGSLEVDPDGSWRWTAGSVGVVPDGARRSRSLERPRSVMSLTMVVSDCSYPGL